MKKTYGQSDLKTDIRVFSFSCPVSSYHVFACSLMSLCLCTPSLSNKCAVQIKGDLICFGQKSKTCPCA